MQIRWIGNARRKSVELGYPRRYARIDAIDGRGTYAADESRRRRGGNASINAPR
jgi:hypothetical protein